MLFTHFIGVLRQEDVDTCDSLSNNVPGDFCPTLIYDDQIECSEIVTNSADGSTRTLEDSFCAKTCCEAKLAETKRAETVPFELRGGYKR